MSNELLQQALDALENSVDSVIAEHREAAELYGDYSPRQAKLAGLWVLVERHEAAIVAIRQALAQPVQPATVLRD